MVSEIGLALGGLVAAEATGVTNFSGGSGGGGTDRGFMPPIPNPATKIIQVPGNTGGSSEALIAALAASRKNSGLSPEQVQQAVASGVKQGRNSLPTNPGLPGGNGGGSPIGFPKWIQNTPVNPQFLQNGDNQKPREFNLTQLGHSDNPIWKSIGVGSEIAKETGKTAGATGKFVNENRTAVAGGLGAIAATAVTGGLAAPLALAAAGGGGEVIKDVWNDRKKKQGQDNPDSSQAGKNSMKTKTNRIEDSKQKRKWQRIGRGAR